MNILKNLNSVLSERLVSMERQCWENAQYCRRECLELRVYLAVLVTATWKKKFKDI